MDLTSLPAALFFPVLSYCWNLVRQSLCGEEDPCSKGAPPTSLKARFDKVFPERKQQPLTRGYDVDASERRMGLRQWQDDAVSDEEGSSCTPASTAQPIEEASPAELDTDWTRHHAECVADAAVDVRHDIGAQEEDNRRKAAEFWTWCSETQSWYHKDIVTGEEIWAPFELD